MSKKKKETTCRIFSIRINGSMDNHPLVAEFFDTWCDRFCYQLELGEETKKLHFQGYGRYYSTAGIRESSFVNKCLDWFSESAWLEFSFSIKYASNRGKLELERYVTKEETRIEGPWCDNTWSPPPDEYDFEDLACMSVPYPWQHQMISLISAKCSDRRTIHWIYEPDGNVGKSMFAKYVCCKLKLAKRINLGTATQVKASSIEVGQSNCYIADIPRSTGKDERMTDMLSAIEELKNGWVGTCMYGKHKELIMNPPHIIIFSNDKCPYHLLSADKWKVYKIDKLFKTLVFDTNVTSVTRSINRGQTTSSEAPKRPRYF